MGANDILASSECQEMMTKDEQKECDKVIGDANVTRIAVEEIASLVKSVRMKFGKKLGKRKLVKWLGEGPQALDAGFLNANLPGNYYIRRDGFNARWRVFQRGTKWTSSKSWGAGREHQCVEGCMIAAWSRHESLTGEQCHIVGLFNDRPDSSAAGSSAA